MNKVVVIGGGIIGLYSAWFLKKERCDVALNERDTESNEILASYVNAGMIAVKKTVFRYSFNST